MNAEYLLIGTMRQETGDRKRVGTTQTSFDILELVRASDGVTLREVATELKIARSTAHRHLATLFDLGFLIKEAEEYFLGLRFLEYGEEARDQPEFKVVKPKVEMLAKQTSERVQFVVEQHGYTVFVYIEHGENAIHTDPGPGARVPIHVGGSGKAILAYYPKDKVNKILKMRGLTHESENTITENDKLFEELQSIREKGYAINNQEYIDGLRAVGVPIKGKNNHPIGGLSISGPTYRMSKDRIDSELSDLLLGVANEIELNMEYND